MIGRAWLAAYTGQLSTVEPLLVKAETQIDSLQTESELQKLCGHIATIRAYINWIGDRRDIASQAARTALEWLPAKEYLIRCQALTLLGLILPSFDEREQALNLALVYAKECSVSHVTIFAYSCWAWQFVMRGKLHEAQAACQEAITHAQVNPSYQPLPTLSHVYATLSTVLYVWNDLEPALRYAKEAVELARRWGQADALHFALDTLGYALFASGDIERAFEASHQAWQVACRTSKWFEEITISQEVEWYIALHKLDEAVSRLHEAHMDSTEAVMRSLGSFRTSLLPFSFIQVLLAQKDFSTAVRLIPLLIEELKSRQVGYYLVRLYLWQALAYQGLHQHPLALSSLEEAFVVAAPQGYVTTFIQEGSEMRALLLRARAAGIQPAYIDTLLAAFDSPTKAHPADKRLSSDLIEPLSSRELDVLKLLSQGCSDKKIAESLVIARETVHKHLKNIYGKLDVHSRTEAIARARDLSLL
jgi:LuxR family maltose regulon positive regulatory protein